MNYYLLIGSILLACMPAFLWGYIFFIKKPEDKKLTILTFLTGSLAVFPILFYKHLWEYFPWINAFNLADLFKEDRIGITMLINIPLSVIITFMIVGLIEETAKMIAVKIVDDGKFRSIDDAIEFFIIGALGFSFVENILYFYNIWSNYGTYEIFLPFLFRSSFSTFAHLVFSGILGYYYGIAYFSTPVYQEEVRQNRHPILKTLHKYTRIKGESLFHREKLLEGMLIAIGLHAIFNIFLEINLTILIAPFLIGGYITLNYLFAKKENHKKYGNLTYTEPENDYQPVNV